MNKKEEINPSPHLSRRRKSISRLAGLLIRSTDAGIQTGVSIVFFTLLCLFLSNHASAQSGEIKLDAVNQPLNSLLLQLRDQNDLQLSYNDRELSKYNVTVHETFRSTDEALNYIIRDLPFRLKISGGVYIIVPDRKKLKEDYFSISGQIVESGTMEPLPFSQIQIDHREIETDETGNFSYTAPADSLVHIRISHPGYFIFDTTLNVGMDQRFALLSPYKGRAAVTDDDGIIERSSQIGEKAGNMKVNANIARYLPGQGDNSVFNLLKLMPGIQAAGEQTTDLSIWGSTLGQSMVTFDEFTLFGMKNYNDNISVVNPLMVKNMEIFKGGFEAKYGNRVGGFVNINGKNGSLQKPAFTINVNPTTLNGMAEIPLFKRSSLIIAGRQTYYNLYDLNDFNIYAPTRPVARVGRGRDAEQPDINIYPENYRFADLNLKYTFNFKNKDLFFISAYQGGDLFKLSADADMTRTLRGGAEIPFNIQLDNTENNSQRGISAFYSKNWGERNNSKIIVTHSDISTTINDEIHAENLRNGDVYIRKTGAITNTGEENAIRSENILTLSNGHQVEFGAMMRSNSTLIQNTTSFSNDTLINENDRTLNNRGILYVQDELPVTKDLTLRSGIRFVMSALNGVYAEPRLSATWKMGENFRLNGAWGLYNQFIFKMENIDRYNSIAYLWVTSNETTKVPHANHFVGGVNYFKNDFTVNVDVYYKTIDNLSRNVFIRNPGNGAQGGDYAVYSGDAKILGTDIYFRKDIGKNAVWASYTLSKTEDRFAPPGSSLPAYQAAPNDQRHEFKVAALYNIGKFCLSGNFVYGSGIEAIREIYAEESGNISYNRLDLGLTYKFNRRKFYGETGVSILNVFDHRNLTQSNLKSISVTDQLDRIRINTEAVPFTPVLFLRVSF